MTVPTAAALLTKPHLVEHSNQFGGAREIIDNPVRCALTTGTHAVVAVARNDASHVWRCAPHLASFLPTLCVSNAKGTHALVAFANKDASEYLGGAHRAGLGALQAAARRLEAARHRQHVHQRRIHPRLQLQQVRVHRSCVNRAWHLNPVLCQQRPTALCTGRPKPWPNHTQTCVSGAYYACPRSSPALWCPVPACCEVTACCAGVAPVLQRPDQERVADM